MTQFAPVCAFPMEITTREFEPRLLLAYSFLVAGMDCIIGSKQAVRNAALKEERPVIYFDKGIWLGSARLYEHIRSRGGLVVSLMEEGLIPNPYDWWSDLFRRAIPRHVLRFVDLVCAWGTMHRDIHVDIGRENGEGFSMPEILLSGHPRFDLAKSRFRPYHTALAEAQGQRPQSDLRYVLVNTNFGFANNVASFDELLRRNEGVLPVEFWKKAYHHEQAVMEAFIEMLKVLATALDGVANIIIRPHLIEKKETWIQEFSGRPNVSVSNQGPSLRQIADSAIVMHHDCTTGIEAYFGEKPVISFRPFDNPEFVQQLPVSLSELCESKEEVVSCVVRLLEDSKPVLQTVEKNEILREFIANIDKESTESIVDCVRKLWDELGGSNRSIPFRAFWWNSIYAIRARYYFLKAAMKGPKAIREAKAAEKLKASNISKDDITERIKLLNLIEEGDVNPTVTELESGCFWLSVGGN